MDNNVLLYVKSTIVRSREAAVCPPERVGHHVTRKRNSTRAACVHRYERGSSNHSPAFERRERGEQREKIIEEGSPTKWETNVKVITSIIIMI